MATAPLSDEIIKATLSAYAEHRSESKAADAMQIPRSTFQCRLKRARAIRAAQESAMPPPDTSQLLERLRKRGRNSRLVITSAQNATKIHTRFFQSLKRYCKATSAQLVVIPYRYQNPTSIWGKDAKLDDWWDDKLVPYLLDQRLDINKHLTLLADIKTQPTAVSPLTGFETITSARSAIIGHPRMEMRTIPTPQEKLPKMLFSTGAVTQQNYTQTKAGKKGEFHHTIGALVVECNGHNFWVRQINAVADGSFYELDHLYTPDGVSKSPRVAALVMGDSHIEFIDPDVVKATFGPGGIVPTLKPEVLVWHDVLDFYSRNHHHAGRVFTNYAKHLTDMDNVERWLDVAFQFIDKHTPKDTRNVFVASNHPDALARWVQECDPKSDPKNVLFWAKTFSAMLEGTRMSDGGAETIDPMDYWAHLKLKCYERSRFLKRDESHRIKGIEVGYHGDQGPNGSRGNIRGFTKIGTKSVLGHSHVPGIVGGVYQVGTSSRLRLEYNQGPSSWSHCHAIIYPNGKRTLCVILQTGWRG